MSKASFQKLARKIRDEYRKKGYSLQRASEIGDATAAKVAREKRGR